MYHYCSSSQRSIRTAHLHMLNQNADVISFHYGKYFTLHAKPTTCSVNWPNAKKPLLIIGCPGGETGPQQIQLFRNFQCDLAEPAFTTQQSTAGKISGNMSMFFLERPPRLTPSLGHSGHIDRGSYKTPGNSQNVWCLNALTDKSRPGKWYITHKEWGQRGRQIVVLGE